MFGDITYTLTANLEHFLIVLTSVAIVAISALIILELVHKSNSNRVFWPVVYFFTVVNVVVWAFVLC